MHASMNIIDMRDITEMDKCMCDYMYLHLGI